MTKSARFQSQELFKGITLEKIIDLETKGSAYLLNIESKLFCIVDLILDFTSSKGITLLHVKNPIINASIPPFTKSTIARFTINPDSEFKFTYKYTLKHPPIQLHTSAIAPFKEEINNELLNNEALKNISIERMNDAEITTFFALNQRRFIDLSFPPKDESIGLSADKIASNFGCLIHWRRLKSLMEKVESEINLEDIKNIDKIDPDPCDVKQGVLNNSQVVSAISVIAEHPSLIHRLLSLTHLLQNGLIKVQLYIQGEWKTVIIDDYVPCYPLGDPLFSKNKSTNIWFMVLEKALAKIYNGYSKLINCDVKNTLINLTGCPTFSYKFSDQVILNEIQNDKFWNILKEWLLLQFLVTVTPKLKPGLNIIPNLPRENSYQVHRIILVEGQKIISIRNPWASINWKGDWSQNSPLWTPSIIKSVEPNFAEYPDNFWVSWDTFLRSFEEITVCKVSGWNELYLRGKFVTVVNTKDISFKRFTTNTYFQLTVKKKTSVIFGIHQEDEDIGLGSQMTPYIDIGLAVLAYKDGFYEMIKFLDSDIVRQNYMEMYLDAGDYKIVPFSIGIVLQQQLSEQKQCKLTPQNITFLIRNIFEKYVIHGNTMSFEQLLLIAPLLDDTIKSSDLEKKVREANKKNTNNLTVQEFEGIFRFYLRNKNDRQIFDVFHNFGYSENFLSHRSRKFTVSFHSSNAIQVKSMDAMQENIDLIVNITLVQKFGRIVEDFNEVVIRENSPVLAKYYYNQLINNED